MIEELQFAGVRGVTFEPLIQVARVQLKQVVVEVVEVDGLPFRADARAGRDDLRARRLKPRVVPVSSSSGGILNAS